MPNWVYNTIRINDALTDKQKQILEQIKQKGLCDYYLPMPTTLNITSGSAVDNTTNDCWVEEFDREKDCIEWLYEFD